ncbi:ribonuclease P protein component [bacterium]|nr:ribonuclease P protein component [bacterium]
MKAYPFPPAYRVVKGRDFARLKVEGKVFRTKKLIFNYAPATLSRVGVIVTKKVGNAVFRSLVKRWVRESYRLTRPTINQPIDIVIIPRTSKLSFAAISQDLSFFIGWLDEKNTH